MRAVAVLASTTSAAFETPNAVRVDPCARQVDLDYVTYERGGGNSRALETLRKTVQSLSSVGRAFSKLKRGLS